MNLSLIVLLSVYIPNHVVNFIIIIELLKWIYRIIYDFFFTAYTETKSRFATDGWHIRAIGTGKPHIRKAPWMGRGRPGWHGQAHRMGRGLAKRKNIRSDERKEIDR